MLAIKQNTLRIVTIIPGCSVLEKAIKIEDIADFQRLCKEEFL